MSEAQIKAKGPGNSPLFAKDSEIPCTLRIAMIISSHDTQLLLA